MRAWPVLSHPRCPLDPARSPPSRRAGEEQVELAVCQDWLADSKLFSTKGPKRCFSVRTNVTGAVETFVNVPLSLAQIYRCRRPTLLEHTPLCFWLRMIDMYVRHDLLNLRSKWRIHVFENPLISAWKEWFCWKI